MSFISFQFGQLFQFICLLAFAIAHAIDSTSPLCAAINGEAKNEHKIYFKDNEHGIRTIELNGTIVGCYPDALVINEVRSDAPLASKSSFRPNISKCARNYEIFCPSGDNYPIGYVQFVLHKHWQMLSFAFHNDVIDPNEPTIDL